MSEEKPHLVLEWHFDCNTKELSCTLADGEVKYIAHDGGYSGYTKIENDTEVFIDEGDWPDEKHWISEQFGEIYGYYQPDDSREAYEPRTKENEKRTEGLGRDGEYLDHLQRSQRQLENGDMSLISTGIMGDTNREDPIPVFLTPDCGLTIYKLLPTNDTYYNGHYNKEAEDGVWAMVPQPCMMQPRSHGYILSNYEEMELVGFSEEIIEQCRTGKWPAPLFPELQERFTYPTENELPLTLDNVNTVY